MRSLWKQLTVLCSVFVVFAPTRVNSADAWDKTCGPPNYCARTDLGIEPYSDTPPVLGPAGSIIRDPAFGSRILRVTGPMADPYGKGRSFMTTASAEQNTWNSDSTQFYVLTPSGQRVLYDFDPVFMTARQKHVLPFGDGDFSYTEPHVLYGVLGDNPAFEQYDTSNGKLNKLHSIADCVSLKKADFTYGVSVSANDQRMKTLLGPGQDKAYLVYVYDRKLGCRWYNTQTGEIGGQWGPKGTISAADRFSVHSSKMSKSGEFIWIDRGYTTVGKGWVVWEVATAKVFACPSSCGGHLAMGYSHIVGPSGQDHPLDFLVRPLRSLSETSPVIKNLQPLRGAQYWYSHHLSWNHIDAGDTTPFCLSTFSLANPQGPGAPLQADVPWENEILCVAMDGKDSRVWRFAHTYSTAKNGFWSTPRGNVSQDGRFFLFTSDWQDQLGENPVDKGHYRTDVFVVELR